MLDVKARDPGSEITCRIAENSQRVRRISEQEVGDRVTGQCVCELILAAAVHFNRPMERKISQFRAKLCRAVTLLPQDVIDELKGFTAPLLRQIRCVADIRKSGDQNRRLRGWTQNTSRLQKVRKGKPALLDEVRRKDMRVVESQGVGLQRIFHA